MKPVTRGRRRLRMTAFCLLLSATMFLSAVSALAAGKQQRIPSAASDWRTAYRKELEKDPERAKEKYAFLYIDQDNVPELLVRGTSEAKGNRVLTWHNGLLDTLQTNRRAFSYQPHNNLFANSDGLMGAYYDDIYSISNGMWKLVNAGVYGGQDCRNWTYYWQGRELSQDEYEKKLHEVYDENKAVTVNPRDSYRTVSNMLKSGSIQAAAEQKASVPNRRAPDLK